MLEWSDMKRKLYKLLCIGPYRGKLEMEARFQKQFCDKLRYLTIEGNLKAVWCAIPNENPDNNNKLFGIKLKHLGKIKGAPDLVFLWDSGCGFIEFKSMVGRQTEEQKDFEEWCKFYNVRYEVAKSPQQAELILKNWGLLN